MINAEEGGLEPPKIVLKTIVLPLNYSPLITKLKIINKNFRKNVIIFIIAFSNYITIISFFRKFYIKIIII